jgi:hypothetical protein
MLLVFGLKDNVGRAVLFLPDQRTHVLILRIYERWERPRCSAAKKHSAAT